MLRPFEEDPLFAPTTADTEEEFEEWVEKHREPVMMKLTLDNYFNVWVRFVADKTSFLRFYFKIVNFSLIPEGS